MNKTELDTQLIEAAILEKWNPIALGCGPNETNSLSSCILCQVYLIGKHWNRCDGCPVKKCTGTPYCDTSPYDEYADAKINSPEEFDAIEAEIEFLISLLPKTHEWRN